MCRFLLFPEGLCNWHGTSRVISEEPTKTSFRFVAFGEISKAKLFCLLQEL